ncbi:MAG: methionine adenosyltransferase [Bacteroidales bacterium]|nr:methionine adenosyltransferase [Bacteroidales bacterium]
MNYLFTSESVSEGHPDKVADQISDAILDAFIQLDPNAKVACECLITTNRLIIAGEAKALNADKVNSVEIAKNVIRDIGYDSIKTGFDYRKAEYTLLLHEQSPEINISVSSGGAGDQGLMFGYACDETPELMPMPISIAHKLMSELAGLRKSGKIPWLRPDAKSQVSVRYEDGKPAGIEKVVISTQHREDISQKQIRETLMDELILPVARMYFPHTDPDCLINPSGSFTIGGPHGDTGLTGRKIIVDTYGGSCPHGGGAFSGKDPSKVDRSAAYAARYVAKHIVASGVASRCTIQVSYAIGKEDPTSLYVNLHGTGKVDEARLITTINGLFDLRPNGIIRMLDLKRPTYLKTAAYGHFGKADLPWEIVDSDIVRELQLLLV